MTRQTDTAPCGWNTGTAMSGPSRCGKPSKASTNHPSTNNGRVCGIHARSARNAWVIRTSYAVQIDKPTDGCTRCGGRTVAEHLANVAAFGAPHAFGGAPEPDNEANAQRVAEGSKP